MIKHKLQRQSHVTPHKNAKQSCKYKRPLFSASHVVTCRIVILYNGSRKADRQCWAEHVWNVMAHAQKPYLVFQRNGRFHLNRWGSQFSRLLAVEECGSAGRPWIDHVPSHSARVVATLSNHLFPLNFPSHASPCAITFRTASNCSRYGVVAAWFISERPGNLLPISKTFTLLKYVHSYSHCGLFWNG